MYDISTKEAKKGKSLFYILLLIGLFFLMIPLFLIGNGLMKKKTLDGKTLSTSVNLKIDYSDGEDMYSPVYDYEVNGKVYKCSSSFSSNIKPSGASQTIYYNSTKPWECMIEGNNIEIIFLTIFLVISIITILIAVINIAKINKRVKAIKRLNKHGKLIKKIPYTMVDSNIYINGQALQKIAVTYILPSGTKTMLYSDVKFDRNTIDIDGYVDLVIDKTDPTNYFIDFEINRLTGNLKEDYYNSMNEDSMNDDKRDVHYQPDIFNEATVYKPSVEFSKVDHTKDSISANNIK